MPTTSKPTAEVLHAAAELSDRLADVRVMVEPAVIAGWTALERQWVSNWATAVEQAVEGIREVPREPPTLLAHWLTQRQRNREVAAFRGD